MTEWVSVQTSVRRDVHDYLKQQRSSTGLSMAATVSAILTHAAENGWQVQPPSVTPASLTKEEQQ